MGIERVVCRSVLSRRRCWDKTYAPFPYNSKSHDVKEVYLWVLEENFAARKFYESHGYVYTGNKKEFSDSGKYLLNYALRLKATL